MNFARRRWQTSPVTGESAKETVKTIARGMPGDSRWGRGDYARVLFYFAREATGALDARHSLRPPMFRWRESKQQLARMRGEIVETCLLERRHCLRQTRSVCASEQSAKQSILSCCSMDC